MSDAAVAPVAAIPAAAGRAQLAALVPAELKRLLLRWRVMPVLLLAFAPAAMLAARLVKIQLVGGGEESAGELANRFAMVFQAVGLRTTLFFGCVVLFTGLFRGEILERTLHYYLLAPLDRRVLLLGKYLAGVAAATLLYGVSVIAQLVLLYLPSRGFDGAALLLSGATLRLAASYLLVVLLACAGYGALFVFLSLAFRNPVIPAAVVLGWEGINFLLPATLKRISFLHYLQSLCPVPVSAGPFSLPTEPTAGWLAVLALLALAAVFLTLAARRLARLEVAYAD
jgi:ABC-type transport system involved in multi-copper enzyme maturation permease subunit